MTYQAHASQSFAAAKVLQVIQPFLQPGDRAQVKILNASIEAALDDTWHYESTLGHQWSPRFVMVVSKDGVKRGFPVQVTIERAVYVATKPVATGESLSADNTTISFVALQSGSQWIPATQSLNGLTAKLPLAAGQPVDARKITHPAEVNARQPVTIDLLNDEVVLTFQGIAQMTGVTGQSVPVMHGKKKYYGTVTGPNRVKVVL